jgi:hypothetical protein
MIFALVLVAIVLATLAGYFLLNYAGKYGDFGFLALLGGITILFGAGIASVCYAFTIWSWFAADSKANIINREYGTAYTQEEVFFAADVIDTIRQIDRKRIEVNGDLMRDKADK